MSRCYSSRVGVPTAPRNNPHSFTRRENSMSFGTGALASAVGGIVLGGIVAFGANSAMAQNSIPDVTQPPADQALLGQVEYGAR